MARKDLGVCFSTNIRRLQRQEKSGIEMENKGPSAILIATAAFCLWPFNESFFKAATHLLTTNDTLAVAMRL